MMERVSRRLGSDEVRALQRSSAARDPESTRSNRGCSQSRRIMIPAASLLCRRITIPADPRIRT